jgi:hypothetical protein
MGRDPRKSLDGGNASRRFRFRQIFQNVGNGYLNPLVQSYHGVSKSKGTDASTYHVPQCLKVPLWLPRELSFLNLPDI